VRTDGTLTAHDARTGQQLWQKPHSISGSVTAARGKVFFPHNPTLFALDQATGNVVWSFPLPYPVNGGAPEVEKGLLFVPQADGMKALDADTGALV
jgi:outer membrane protein assembly factor BamB